jgi:hypothetical protein
MEILLKIGDHDVLISSASVGLTGWIKTYFHAFEPGNTSTNKPADLSIHVKAGYGAPFANYHVEITADSNRVFYRRADYLIEVDRTYHAANIAVYDDFALKHALINLFSAFIAHHRWGLLIHASCIADQGKAYLFAGRSGAGKSTVARLSFPKPVLADEAAIVKIDENEIMVYNSPFRSDSAAPYWNHACRLSSIQLLIQSADVKTSIVKKSDAMLRILDKVFFWHHDASETAKVLKMCKQLADKVPVYDMYFKKNDTFWELII